MYCFGVTPLNPLPYLCVFVLTENVDYLPISTTFVFSQQQSTEQCVSVVLLEDDNFSEETEQFGVNLSMSNPVANVMLSQTSAIILISDSVSAILSDIIDIARTGDQTEENLRIISGTVEDIANSALNDEIEVSMEVYTVFLCECLH